MRGKQIKLGMAVKMARNDKKMTQSELADKLNISVRYLQTIENENQTPSYGVLERIFEILDIPSGIVFENMSEESSMEKEKLLYLINNKCSRHDVNVLLATVEAMTADIDL